MERERMEALERELLDYASDMFDDKDYEITCLEIRTKLDSLNQEIDQLLEEDGDKDDRDILTHITYQYYRLLYT